MKRAISSSLIDVCVYVCVFVCVCEREYVCVYVCVRERKRKRERE